MSSTLRGFPDPFPVRVDGRRPLRYRTVSGATRAVMRGWFGSQLDVRELQGMPHDGPLLVVCNHLSNIDPFLFGGYAPGAMFCMAKRELFALPPVAWVLGGCNCYPVERGAPDRWALRTTLQLLARGGRVLIFVEGTRSSRPGMRQVETGVGFLARRSGVPVLPVAVWGSENALRRGTLLPRRTNVRVRVGAPFRPDIPAVRHADRAIADEIAGRIAELLPPMYRGLYGAKPAA
ncbi:MAG: 1-acyl-sn-glycerol-3-phosphate acyltransferase [Candidatus Dormibacteraeota bacterium]|nr:1-acyl-sn-glycerol-3-phosphate acyltransferase [Candidatus Dormibacteraeota bacterium]MBV8444927.1 1-acyl-sn-glycerol-3-phosphate acyltransferase [Candidatus Dormibacteraeota bacterium]